MVTKNKIFGEEGLKPSDVEKNLNLAPLSAMDSTDNTTQTDSRSTVGTNSYTTKRTLSIDAGAISNYIIIRFDLSARATSSRGSATDTIVTATANAQITIDSTQKFTSSITAQAQSSNTSTWANYRGPTTRMCTFKYVPTSDEKTNGFTIDLDLACGFAIADPGSGVAYCDNFHWEVWGA